MFIHMSIHVPNPGYEQAVLDSMNRVRLAALGTPGLVHIGPFREDGGGRVVGIAIWESRGHWVAALPGLFTVVEDDDPAGLWHAKPPERILLEDAGVLPPDDLLD